MFSETDRKTIFPDWEKKQKKAKEKIRVMRDKKQNVFFEKMNIEMKKVMNEKKWLQMGTRNEREGERIYQRKNVGARIGIDQRRSECLKYKKHFPKIETVKKWKKENSNTPVEIEMWQFVHFCWQYNQFKNVQKNCFSPQTNWCLTIVYIPY